MIEAIINRRSIRKFKSEDVDGETVNKIIEMGTWAPSGLNNQPWKFTVIRTGEIKKELSMLTKYGNIIAAAPVCIAVFLDNDEGYNRIKDIQAVGACLQNMLLAIYDMGLGGVWLGEILNKREQVEKILGVPDSCELMAVIAIGYLDGKKIPGSRRPLGEVILDIK